MTQDGKMSEEYCSKLKQMELKDIAELAAHNRGDYKDNGAATRAIRAWVVAHKSTSEVREYDRYYRVAWSAEKRARRSGEKTRASDRERPCVSDWKPRKRPEVFERNPASASLAAHQPKGSVYA